MRPLLAWIPLALCACATPPAPPPAAPAPAPPAPVVSVVASAPPPVYPAPYTAEQLRAAARVGRAYVFRVEAEGKPTVLRELRFTHVDAERAEVATTVKDEAGKVLDAKPPRSAAWAELRSHGEFPGIA